MVGASILVVFLFCMVFAALSDLVSMTIANRVSLLLVASFAVLAPLSGIGWAAFGWHFAACALVLTATFGLFALGVMGGGDAKLMAATALWMGLGPPLASYLVAGALLGGVLTLLLVAFRASPAASLVASGRFLSHLGDRKAGIPYGVALGAAGLLAAPEAPLVAWALAH